MNRIRDKPNSMIVTKKIQYTCAVLLIVTSILMVSFQVFTIQDVANGLLIYIGQAFLLAGSIFGLDYYIDKMKYIINDNGRKSSLRGV